jgi:galactokinase
MGIGSNQESLRQELRRRFGVESAAVRFVFAPYRICPLGAHIDHQLGMVTALAIDRGVLLAYAPAANREVRLGSLEYPGEIHFSLDQPGAAQRGDWGNYARGAVTALTRAGHPLPHGMTGVITGPWSEGGLSSSAAVGVAYLLALEDINGLTVTSEQNILLDQAIENDYLGLRNGILDQSGILLSRRNQLIVIDCATRSHRLVPVGASSTPWSLLLAFSGLRQALTGTDYNRRVAECAEAARILLAAAGRTEKNPVLSNVREREYAAHKGQLPSPLDRRAEHFFSETSRVCAGVEAWQRGDLREFGRLMTASGESSIRNYECGCPPLIDLYEILVQCPGVLGARFSGAGFRGCCIALVDRTAAAQVATEITRRYAERQPSLAANAAVVMVHSDDGARKVVPGAT